MQNITDLHIFTVVVFGKIKKSVHKIFWNLSDLHSANAETSLCKHAVNLQSVSPELAYHHNRPSSHVRLISTYTLYH